MSRTGKNKEKIMKRKKKTLKLYRIDYDTSSREIIEIYEVSPDGAEVLTKDGWVPSSREGIICQRPPHEPGHMTAEQVEFAIKAEREFLKEKKFKHTASYQVAIKYPIKEWLEGV